MQERPEWCRCARPVRIKSIDSQGNEVLHCDICWLPVKPKVRNDFRYRIVNAPDGIRHTAPTEDSDAKA